MLCGVEGNESSTEAARQAITLARDGAALRFVAVYTSRELGPDRTKEKLQEALDEVAQLAREAGVAAETEMQEGRYAVDVLLAEGEKHDLLVIGTHGKSRAAGIVLGSTASEAAHQTERPLMIAREPSLPEGFPTGILFAGDGSGGSWAPARFAAGLAAAFDETLEVVHVDDDKHPEAQDVLDAQMLEIRELTGKEPSLTRAMGAPTDQIVEAASERKSSVIVCGRRGLKGIRALGSVSERVVHQAECSVLLVPAGD